MRTFILAFVLAACGTDGSSRPDGESDAGVGSCDAACPVTAARLGVIDATTRAPLSSPTFAESGATLHSFCGSPDDMSCSAWIVPLDVAGPHTITVSADGYASTTLGVTLTIECCGFVTPDFATVALSAR